MQRLNVARGGADLLLHCAPVLIVCVPIHGIEIGSSGSRCFTIKPHEAEPSDECKAVWLSFEVDNLNQSRGFSEVEERKEKENMRKGGMNHFAFAKSRGDASGAAKFHQGEEGSVSNLFQFLRRSTTKYRKYFVVVPAVKWW